MISAKSDAAFTVEFEASTAPSDALGPKGLGTRISIALSPHSGDGWIFPLRESWKNGHFLYIFRETDRAEVMRRFATIGIVVPPK